MTANNHQKSLELFDLSGIETAYLLVEGQKQVVNAYALGDRTIIKPSSGKNKVRMSLTFQSDFLRSPELYFLSMGYRYEGFEDRIEKGAFLSAYPKNQSIAKLWHVGTEHPFKIRDSSLVNSDVPHPERMLVYYQGISKDIPIIKTDETITQNNQYRLIKNELGNVLVEVSRNLIGKVIYFVNTTIQFRYIAKTVYEKIPPVTVYCLARERTNAQVVLEFKGNLIPPYNHTNYETAIAQNKELDFTPIWMRPFQELRFNLRFVQKQYL